MEPGAGTVWASVEVRAVGRALEAERAPLAVVLVLDVSGSMRGEPLAHVVRSCEVVASLLGPQDRLAIVTFGSRAGVRCGLTTVDEGGRALIEASVRGLSADGNTNMHGGLEVAAGVLMTAPAALRRVMVLLSDGQPNVGLASAAGLAGYVRTLGLAVSTLGFGLHHDENVLDAIATAGSGRYAYIPDPALARLDLARAALAHGGIVADQLELRIEPAEGVELVRVLPVGPLRHGKHGTITALGDVFVDEGRTLALELRLDLRAGATGRLATLTVAGRGTDGSRHTATATLDVDVRVGARVIDPAAQRTIVLVQADAARLEARAQADRGALAGAAAILRQVVARIEALPGFVRNDGSQLAELREQLDDEAASFERTATDSERAHQRKASVAYKTSAASYTRAVRAPAPLAARLAGIGGPVAGEVYALMTETVIGRGRTNDVVVGGGSLSRHHAQVVFVDGGFRLIDMGSTAGSLLNGRPVTTAPLTPGDRIQLGEAVFRFEHA